MQTVGGLRVVIVHDYLTQRGGAERVVLDMLRAYPGARVVTAFWNRSSTFPQFDRYPIKTLNLDRFAPLRHDPRRALPLLAHAFSRHEVHDADLVLCSSSGWSHRVTTTAPKIVYCHNPARWLYQLDDYLPNLNSHLRQCLGKAIGGLRRSDRAAAGSATGYLVNSTLVADRVRATYAIESQVVAPARGVNPQGPQRCVPGIPGRYLLTVARARGYKHIEAICTAFAGLPDEHLVVVGGRHDIESRPPNITVLHDVDDRQLRWLYAHAGGLVAMANEDFGLTLPEAQGFGIPTVALRFGGYLDTMVDGVTGVFVNDPRPELIRAGVRSLRERSWNRALIRDHGERYSGAAFAERLQAAVHRALTSLALPTGPEAVLTHPPPPHPASLIA